MASNREKAGCCSGNTSRLMPDAAKRLAEKRVADAINTGATILLDGCTGCHSRFTTLVKDGCEMEYKNLIELIARGHGIRHENKWKKLTASKDIDRIIEICKEHIKESPFSEEDIRRELPKYLLGAHIAENEKDSPC
jgi:hypothetical protein